MRSYGLPFLTRETHVQQENYCSLNQISMKFALKVPTDKLALIQVLAWCQTGDTPFQVPMLIEIWCQTGDTPFQEPMLIEMHQLTMRLSASEHVIRWPMAFQGVIVTYNVNILWHIASDFTMTMAENVNLHILYNKTFIQLSLNTDLASETFSHDMTHESTATPFCVNKNLYIYIYLWRNVR